METSLSASDNRPGNQFVLIQDCFRYFDLETVGTDNAHLSFFEMPGAFVFGKNERQSTIRHMWKLVTQALGIDPAHIWVSYFRGDKLGKQEFPRDDRTYQAWRTIGISSNRLVGLAFPTTTGFRNPPRIPGNAGQVRNCFMIWAQRNHAEGIASPDAGAVALSSFPIRFLSRII
ncbi:MAG: hypothetical protein B6245_00040 [Desulfobacteraceae bacterium 4572_88]|nr:MAG: hypothetical protein B6245_00040 [Desulfobacteraceae bacterium 4572_88]